MPRVMVFTLNGGGDVPWLGPRPPDVAAVVMGVVTPPGVDGVVVVAPFGDTSGEKMQPIAYSDRFSPYCFTRCRLTSMISTSTTTSARGLSFCWISFSKIWTTGAVARMVIELCALFGALVRWADGPAGRNATLSTCANSVASAFER